MLNCNLHGTECPNEFRKQPLSYLKEVIRRDSTDKMLHESMISTCQIESIFATIALIRRGYQYFDKFMHILSENFTYLKEKASERVLISILDTLADHETPHSHAAIVALTIIREWQITESIYGQATIPDYSHRFIWPTTMSIAPHSPDTIINHYTRVRKSLNESNLVWSIFYKIITKIIQISACPLSKIDIIVSNSRDNQILDTVLKLLNPECNSQ